MTKYTVLTTFGLMIFCSTYLIAQDEKSESSLAKLGRLIKDAEVRKLPLKILDLSAEFIKQVEIPESINRTLGPALTFFDVKLKENQAIAPVRGTSKGGGASLAYSGVVGFSGYMKMGNQKLDVLFNAYEEKSFGGRKFTLAIKYPPEFKPSQLLSELKPLDIFKLPQLQLVLSTFNYVTADGLGISEGTNLIALVDLQGPLQTIGDLKDKAKELKSIVFDMSTPIQMVGKIPMIPKSLSFSINVPLRLGVDFTQIHQIPSELSGFLKKITTDNIVLGIGVGKSSVKKSNDVELPGSDAEELKEQESKSAPKAEISISAQTGIQITIGLQSQPLIFQAFGNVNAVTSDFSVGGKFPSMIEAKYFALGDAGVEIYWDSGLREVAALIGVPFTGIGLRGRIDLGTPSNSRASLSAVGKIALEKQGGVGLIFDVSGQNLSISDIINLLARAMAQAKITESVPKDIVPKMVFNKVRGKFAPFDGTVAGRAVTAGYELEMDAEFFDQKFGFACDVNLQKLMVEGRGWMPSIDLKIDNVMVARLSGTGKDKKPGTEDDGPFVSVKFNGLRIHQAAFHLSALFEMPALLLKSAVEFHYSFGRLTAEIESNAVGFNSLFKLNFDPLKWREMGIAFSFKDDFGKFLTNYAKPAIEVARRQSLAKLAEVDAQVAKLSNQIADAGKEGVSKTEKEIQKTKDTISSLENTIEGLKNKCRKNPLTCIQVGIDLVAPGTKLGVQKLYLEGLLKPGKDVVKETTGAVADLTKDLSSLKITQALLQTALKNIDMTLDLIGKGSSIFIIREVSGGINTVDIAKGKVPLLKVLDISINLPGSAPVAIKLNDIEFDFNQAGKSAERIVDRLLKSVKIGL